MSILRVVCGEVKRTAMGTLLNNPPRPPGESASRKRKLAAILHADVVGFSRLMGEDDAGTHRALGELRRAADPLIASSRPEEFHLRALPEPCMTLSSHTARDVRPLP